jgi:hypothetical protein
MASPLYIAVTVFIPMPIEDETSAACPFPSTGALPNTPVTDPSKKVTLPVGVPAVLVTVAVRVMASPGFPAPGATSTVEVAGPTETSVVIWLLRKPAVAAAGSTM